MRRYLADATCFQDMPVLKKPTGEDHWFEGETVLCPLCKGHGGWILRLDAYGKGKHFKANCSQCNGWGWVEENSPNATCIHTYFEMSQEECRKEDITHFGMCWHVYRCSKCGYTMSQDSSD